MLRPPETRPRRPPARTAPAQNAYLTDSATRIAARQPDGGRDTWGTAASAAHAAATVALVADDRETDVLAAYQCGYQNGIRDGYQEAIGDWRGHHGYWLPAELRDRS